MRKSLSPIKDQNLTDDDANQIAARLLTEAARSAALAYDELFELKHYLAVTEEPERARVLLEVQALHTELATARKTIEVMKSRQQQGEHMRRADHFERRCNELTESTSWRITAPMRALSRLLRGR